MYGEQPSEPHDPRGTRDGRRGPQVQTRVPDRRTAAIPPQDAQGRGTDPQRAHRQDAVGHRLQLSQPLRVQFPRPADPRGAGLGPVVRAERSRALPHGSLSVAHPLRPGEFPGSAGGKVRRRPRLDVVPALFGRRTGQLGLPRTEHGPVGPGDGQQRSGRGLGGSGREAGDGGLRQPGDSRSRRYHLPARRSSTTSMPTASC